MDFHLFSWIFIFFYAFSLIFIDLGGVLDQKVRRPVAACGSLWQPVAAAPLRTCCTLRCVAWHSCCRTISCPSALLPSSGNGPLPLGTTSGTWPVPRLRTLSGSAEHESPLPSQVRTQTLILLVRLCSFLGSLVSRLQSSKVSEIQKSIWCLLKDIDLSIPFFT